MKNIAILIPNLKSGGSERVASTLSCMLEENFNVFVIVFDATDISYEYGGQLINMNILPSKTMLGKYINIAKRVFFLKRIVRREKIDIVCSFVSAADITNAFCKSGAKRIISCRGAALLEKLMKLYHKMCTKSDGILFNSRDMQNFYLKNYPQDKYKTFMIYNPFDITSIREKSKEELDREVADFISSHKVITTVARFVKDKNHWDLIKSFELLKEDIQDAGLMFVGHMGKYENDIKEMANKSKYKDDIIFIGYTSNPFKYVYNSNVYALSSSNEGFPNSLVEAMAVGTPVVSTNCLSGPKEILYNDINTEVTHESFSIADYGIITPCFEANADFNNDNKNNLHKIYADALKYALSGSKEISNIAKKAYIHSEQFDDKIITGEYENLFNNI